MSRTAIVTGASRGIGKAIAMRLAHDGYDIAVCCHEQLGAADDVCEEIRSLGRYSEHYCFDVSDPKAAGDAVAKIHNDFGGINALVNNGGIALYKMISDTDDDEFDRVMNVNMKGVFNMTRAVLPEMVSRKSGAVVNISSMWGIVGGSCEAVYSASKAAVIGFTKAAAKELGPSGIRVNCIAPGVIRTDMLGSLSSETLDDLCDETPLCRLGEPNDVASVAAFLLSNDARFITGQVINADGGMII